MIHQVQLCFRSPLPLIFGTLSKHWFSSTVSLNQCGGFVMQRVGEDREIHYLSLTMWSTECPQFLLSKGICAAQHRHKGHTLKGNTPQSSTDLCPLRFAALWITQPLMYKGLHVMECEVAIGEMKMLYWFQVQRLLQITLKLKDEFTKAYFYACQFTVVKAQWKLF